MIETLADPSHPWIRQMMVGPETRGSREAVFAVGIKLELKVAPLIRRQQKEIMSGEQDRDWMPL